MIKTLYEYVGNFVEVKMTATDCRDYAALPISEEDLIALINKDDRFYELTY